MAFVESYSYSSAERTLPDLFDEIAERFADKVAVTFGAETITYRELRNRADALARQLAAAGVGPDVLVGCSIERSIDLIVALVGILKAGGAYVPLDPSYPDERLDFMLRDANCSVVVAEASAEQRLAPLTSARFIRLSKAAPDLPGATPRAPSARNAAYVMYTSGSTGRPRGVVVEHRPIERLVRETDYCSFSADEVWLHAAPLAFDASTLEIWGPLLNGGRLVVAPQRASLEDLGRLIRTEGVTSAWFTSGLFNLMVEQRLDDLGGLRQLLAGGDVLSPRHVRMALKALPNCTVINGYGPTENTTFTCTHAMRSVDDVTDPISIGRAIAHTTVYVLDDARAPVADGEIGELYTGGEGLARGYLNDPETTADRFVPDPFAKAPDARMYRTLDLVRRGADGLIHFIGRADSQIKILGHRIEPGEIETVLASHPAVNTACVLVDKTADGSKRLIAYYVADDSALDANGVRAFLVSKLPRYMMPTLIVPMCAMPLTTNGKIDRAQLPRPEVGIIPVELPAGKSGSVEDTVLETWRFHLKHPSVALDDNFFDIGGDSLKLVALHADLERRLAREIPIMDLFEFTTPRALARHLTADGSAAQQKTEAAQTRAQQQRAAFARQRDMRKRT